MGRSRFEKMTVFDAVSMQLVNKLSWLANLNLRNGEMMPMPVWKQLHNTVLMGPIEVAEDYDNMESEDNCTVMMNMHIGARPCLPTP